MTQTTSADDRSQALKEAAKFVRAVEEIELFTMPEYVSLIRADRATVLCDAELRTRTAETTRL